MTLKVPLARKRSRKLKIQNPKALSALLALALLSACTAPPPPAPQFTLHIGFFPTEQYLSYFVMQEQGFAKQNSLRFEEISYQAGDQVVKAMETGTVDVGYIGSVPVLVAAERGLIPGKVVSVAANDFADSDHPALGVLIGASVNSWKDLEGQHIGVVGISTLHGAAIKGRLRQEGVRDYTLTEIPLPNMGLAVAGGNVAAATIPEPFLTQSLLRGDGKLLGWVIGGPPFDRMETSLIVFGADLYRNNPQAVKAFLRAHLQALKWMNQNPAGARSVLTKRLALSEEIGQKIHSRRWSLDARSDPALLESMQPLLVEVGMLKAPIPARQLYDETLLEEVLREKR